MSIMEYNGYYGSAEFSQEDEVFHGKLLYIRSLITYESDTAKGLTKSFHNAVDEYLAMAKHDGFEAEKPFKGNFNVRIEPELHRDIALIASSEGVSLNHLVANALMQFRGSYNHI